MSKTFTRIGKDIVMAVKAGGSDPNNNSRLRALIQNAKAANMPKDNVERAIKRATSKEQDDYKEMVYEGKGPHGIAILIEATTDNTNRTVANIRSYFNKKGGSLGTSGMLDYLFDRKCVFKIANDASIDLEELEFEMIDVGAEELFIDEETNEINIYGEFSAYGAIQQFLEEKGYELKGAEFARIPTELKELTEEQVADVDKLLELIEEDDDVQNVYTNMK